MSEQWTNEQIDQIIANWQPSAESFRMAMSVVTAALETDEPVRVALLTAVLSPVVLGGPTAALGTLSALVALVVRSVNTLAKLTDVDRGELWQKMATELEAEIISKLT